MHKLSAPAYRRAGYFVVAAVLAILAAVGVITETQYDSWTGAIEDLLPVLGTVALAVAGAKTHAGSDDPTTREDVLLAAQAGYPAATPQDYDSVAPEAPTGGESSPVTDEELAEAAYLQSTRRD